MPPKQKTPLPLVLSGIVLLLAAVVLSAAFLSIFFSLPLSHDQASYLVEAQRSLAGNQIYGPQISETNPPLIVWFSAIPVLLGQWFHTSPVLLLRLLVLALIGLSTLWCVRVLRRCSAFSNSVSLWLMSLGVLCAEFSIGQHEFAQREHLLILFLLPYLLAVATGAVDRLSRAERCALGLAAGLALWFKPYDITVLIALELFIALRTRSLRRVRSPEFLSLLLTCFATLALVIVFTPLYFSQTYPILLDTYWGLGTDKPLSLALGLQPYMAALFALLLLWYLLRRSLTNPAASLALLVCSFAASIAYDLQHTAWVYHAYPHQALLILAAAFILIDSSDRFLAKIASSLRLQAMLAAAVLVVVLLGIVAVRPRLLLFRHTEKPAPSELGQYLAQYPPATTVYVFSVSVAPVSDVYNLGQNWGSRFQDLWLLPAIVKNERGPDGSSEPFKRLPPQRVAQLAFMLRTGVAEDLISYRPSVVLVERCSTQHFCQALGAKDFDIISWFLKSPQFAKAWVNYQRQPDLESYQVYKMIP